MTTNDGGPAFPSEQGHIPDGTWNQTYESGMSLRDWFAGQALAGTIAGLHGVTESFGTLAADSYAIADAMLAARGGAK